MDPKCEKCVRIAIAGGIIIGCSLGLDEEKCQYLQRHQHVHQKVYIPPEYEKLEIVIATTATTISGEIALDSFPDPEREGNTIYLYDVSS